MQMKQIESNGFTLIEMLLVLSLVSVFLLLIIPIHHTFLGEEKERRFLEVLQFDILAAQNLAMTTPEEVSIRFRSDYYVVLQSDSEHTLYKRTIPDNFEVKLNILKKISFTSKGAIKKAGNIKIKTDKTTYKLICPLGKGRCYIG